MSVFDGLSEIFTGTFGESVVYTPAGGSPRTIAAIWIETPITIAFGDDAGAGTEDVKGELHIPVATLTPAEGDTARRVSTGKTCRIVTPINPDDRGGMTVCALQAIP